MRRLPVGRRDLVDIYPHQGRCDAGEYADSRLLPHFSNRRRQDVVVGWLHVAAWLKPQLKAVVEHQQHQLAGGREHQSAGRDVARVVTRAVERSG